MPQRVLWRGVVSLLTLGWSHAEPNWPWVVRQVLGPHHHLCITMECLCTPWYRLGGVPLHARPGCNPDWWVPICKSRGELLVVIVGPSRELGIVQRRLAPVRSSASTKCLDINGSSAPCHQMTCRCLVGVKEKESWGMGNPWLRVGT
jgi:hypothetical protein